jgi:hypothetical protein
MKRIALILSIVAAAAAAVPALASTDDPTSPFYLLPTTSRGTTLHDVAASSNASTERK